MIFETKKKRYDIEDAKNKIVKGVYDKEAD